MPASKRPHEEHHVNCSVCMKEVPASEANVREAEDYVMYFCGLDCLQAWEQEAGQSRPGPADSEGGQGR